MYNLLLCTKYVVQKFSLHEFEKDFFTILSIFVSFSTFQHYYTTALDYLSFAPEF